MARPQAAWLTLYVPVGVYSADAGTGAVSRLGSMFMASAMIAARNEKPASDTSAKVKLPVASLTAPIRNGPMPPSCATILTKAIAAAEAAPRKNDPAIVQN